MVNIEEMSTFCKAKGFVYPNSEIYGGYSGFFDYGPLGIELKNNIKSLWWNNFVRNREDVVGIDGATISHPKVWKASGHVDCFSDYMVFCKKNKKQFRADQIVEEVLGISADGMTKHDLVKQIKDNKAKFEDNGYDLVEELSDFNLMFKTYVGPAQSEDSVSYLRPETAQLIFTNFRIVYDTMRLKLPFGIAQIGKAFRNEISPRDFLFRCREFEQLEIEYFIHPDQEECILLDDMKFKFNIFTSKLQEEGSEHTHMTISDMIKNKLADKWQIYWLKEVYQWFIEMGIKPENLRLREHLKDELAHYSKACFDIEYKFPFGWKEIHGNADRGQFDLKKHQEVSKKNMEIFDEESKKKVIPRVIEPSQGLDRAFLAFLFDAYEDDEKRGNKVLKLNPGLAPIKIGVFPLVNKLQEKAREIFMQIKDQHLTVYDKSGSIGRRYARADEQGIPYCVTIDFETLEDKCVTIRNRDDTSQQRIPIDELNEFFKQRF